MVLVNYFQNLLRTLKVKYRNYHCKQKIIKHHNYEIHLHPLGYQPFSTFDFSYEFEALFEGEDGDEPIYFDVNSTGGNQIKKKEHLVTFLGFRMMYIGIMFIPNWN